MALMVLLSAWFSNFLINLNMALRKMLNKIGHRIEPTSKPLNISAHSPQCHFQFFVSVFFQSDTIALF